MSKRIKLGSPHRSLPISFLNKLIVCSLLFGVGRIQRITIGDYLGLYCFAGLTFWASLPFFGRSRCITFKNLSRLGTTLVY